MELQIEFLATSMLPNSGEKEKTNYILSNVRENKILVLEEKLTPNEERLLIAETMKQIGNDEKFAGIEISTLGGGSLDALRSALIRFLGGKPRGITVIGPSALVRKIKQDPNSIHLFAQVFESAPIPEKAEKEKKEQKAEKMEKEKEQKEKEAKEKEREKEKEKSKKK
ncbi:MAG: DUF2073 domain-containing protein [Candidatus Micrarchaeota archaeon]